ncbi:MAG: hypothetical protein JXR95_11035 [Deltaproteobacteria bacterium]|nr:hypothetical protein [Deltaproteobacteria bacterium]
MSESYTLKMNCSVEYAFDEFLKIVRKEGYHIEEADKVEYVVRIEKGGFFDFFFGIGSLKITLDFDATEGSGCDVRVKCNRKNQKETISSLLSIIQQSWKTPENNSKQQLVEKIIVKEIVKLQCPYCQSLVENTESKCPQCGGSLTWK